MLLLLLKNTIHDHRIALKSYSVNSALLGECRPLVVTVSHISPPQPSFDHSSTGFLELITYFMVIAKFGGEVLKYLHHVSDLKVENPQIAHTVAMREGLSRFVMLDPWNVLDIVTSIGMLFAIVLRLFCFLEVSRALCAKLCLCVTFAHTFTCPLLPLCRRSSC